jgi:parvulin-like peptidyl-prolyl isomerase
MRVWSISAAALVIAVAGCDVLRDAFSAHPAAAARAGQQTLSVERLAELASRVKGMPLEPANLGRLAGAYIDYTLFALAQADGRTLEDTATVTRAMWPVVSQLKFEHFSERLHAGNELKGAQVDSTYAAGDLRAFQHILVTVPPNAAPPVVQQKQNQINAIWRSLAVSGGTNFAAVAKRSSEDPGSKPVGGWLEVGARGRFVRQFEEAAWQLGPGAMSGVVRTNYGFHVIRRPPLAEVRDSFAAGAERVMAVQHDSTYFANLAKQKEVKVSSGVGEAIRTALQDLEAAGRSHKALASYKGGNFELRDFVRWLYAIDPRIAQSLSAANDSQVTMLVQQLVERTVALQQADSAHVQLSDSEWAAVRVEYDSSLAMLRTLLQLDPAALRDSTTTAEGRTRFAMSRVNDYFDRVVGRTAQFAPVPPLLAQVLRERTTWSIDEAALRQASQRATALRASADSLRPPGGEAPSGAGMRPAPGPPPVVPESVLQQRPTQRVVQ